MVVTKTGLGESGALFFSVDDFLLPEYTLNEHFISTEQKLSGCNFDNLGGQQKGTHRSAVSF
jgi:hypothetical protein